MATRLKMVYNTADGTTTHSYNYVSTDTANTTRVAALSAATITNNVIFQNPPLSLKSATVITTTETNVTPTPNP